MIEDGFRIALHVAVRGRGFDIQSLLFPAAHQEQPIRIYLRVDHALACPEFEVREKVLVPNAQLSAKPRVTNL